MTNLIKLASQTNEEVVVRQVSLFVFIFILFLSGQIQAKNEIVCTPIQTMKVGKTIILPGTDSTKISQIVVFKNTTAQSIWLDHATENRSASAGWSSFLRAGHWSALVLNRKDFAITCAIITPGKLEYQDCSKVISTCTPQNEAGNSKRKGSSWLAEDKTWEELVPILEKNLRTTIVPKGAI